MPEKAKLIDAGSLSVGFRRIWIETVYWTVWILEAAFFLDIGYLFDQSTSDTKLGACMNYNNGNFADFQ
jgi:hypothetical protein